MQKGRIIFLNGVTSSGKTSIVEALQNREDVLFYAVSNDLFQAMVGKRYLRADYWKYLGQVLSLIHIFQGTRTFTTVHEALEMLMAL